MRKRRTLFIILVLVTVVLAAFLILVLGGFLSPQGFQGAWQRDISQFATGFAAQDDRVFTLDISGGIVCYDASNGQTIWNGGIGGYFCSGLTANADIVCGGKPFGVGVLNSSSGKPLYNIAVPIDYSNTPPSSIKIIDGRVVATGRFGMGSSITAIDATSGLLLWEALPYPSVPYFGNITNERDWWVSGYPLEGRFLEQNSVYASIEEETSFYIFKLDTDNGNILWRANVTSLGGSVLALYQGQVIAQNGNSILSLNSTSAGTIWSTDIGATIYQSTTANDLLLFGASDSNFYAIHLANGSLAWKTPIDDENLLAMVNSNNLLTVYPIQNDPENNRIFYAFAVTQQLGTSSETKHDQYTGFLSSINTSTGDKVWTTKFEAADTFYETPVGLAVNRETVFLTSNNYLWAFQVSAGNTLGVQRFDHYVLPPVVSEGKVYVAADLHFTAYT